MPITLPTASPKRALFRKLVDASISMVPIAGGHLAAIYSLTHPPQSEIDEEKWRQEITRLAVDTEAAVNFILKRVTLSEDAAYLGRWMSEHAERGWADIFDYDQIISQFPEASKMEILEALGELELEEMLRINKVIGRPFGNVVTASKLYETFDPIVFEDVSPRRDAATVALAVLDTDSMVSCSALADKHGWRVRRINPALAIVGEMIADGRKSRPLGQPLGIRAMTADLQERARLRRFVKHMNAEA
ncbi:hypothetical protein WNZ15_25235 [Roseibium sp. AS2]|uniref:hypothetical protein n=1 Tax=Roseibium sp. AS2 TaxID=3135781 RepID=UPI003180DF75